MCLPLCGRDIPPEERGAGALAVAGRSHSLARGKAAKKLIQGQESTSHPLPGVLVKWREHAYHREIQYSISKCTPKQYEAYSSHIFYYLYGQYKYNPLVAQDCLATFCS